MSSQESVVGGAIRWYQMRKEWMNLAGVRYETVRYVDKSGDEHVSRRLRSRWFELELAGSVTEFAMTAVKRVMAVAGLAEDPKQAADLVLSLSMSEPGLTGRMGDLARGLVSVLETTNVVGEGGLLEINRQKAKGEMLELALTRMSEYCGNGGSMDPADIAAVLRECGMSPEEALTCLEVGFNLNGQAEGAVIKAYSAVEEGVR
jgi:hypothetical protein